MAGTSGKFSPHARYLRWIPAPAVRRGGGGRMVNPKLLWQPGSGCDSTGASRASEVVLKPPATSLPATPHGISAALLPGAALPGPVTPVWSSSATSVVRPAPGESACALGSPVLCALGLAGRNAGDDTSSSDRAVHPARAVTRCVHTQTRSCFIFGDCG